MNSLYEDLRVRERLQFSGVIYVLVRQKYLCHLLRFVSERRKCFHVAADILACKGYACLIRHFLRCSRRESGVDQYHFIAGLFHRYTVLVIYLAYFLNSPAVFFLHERLCRKPRPDYLHRHKAAYDLGSEAQDI